MLRTLILAYSWVKSSNTAYFIIKCWISHVIDWMLILKVKNRMVSVSRMVVSVLVIYHHNCECMADWELWLTATAQHYERVSHCILLACEKIEILQTVYCFHIMVESENGKSNHDMSGTICKPTINNLRQSSSDYYQPNLVGYKNTPTIYLPPLSHPLCYFLPNKLHLGGNLSLQITVSSSMFTWWIPLGQETLSDHWGSTVLPLPRTNRALLPNGSRWRDAGKTQLHSLTPGGGALRCWGGGEEAFPPDVEIRDLEGPHCFKMYLEDFPHGPVAKTPRSQCRGTRFHPWSEN